MKFDFDSILFALSYALDCVEHDVIGVTTNHGKRVAALCIDLSQKLGVLQAKCDTQALAACAVLHDCALTEYIEDEFDGSYEAAGSVISHNLGIHSEMGEKAVRLMPFLTENTKDAVMYHHENADGSGPFKKKWREIPQSAKLIQIADTIDAGFDLSDFDSQKQAKLCAYIKNNIGVLFEKPEADAFLCLIDDGFIKDLTNEKIDKHLLSLLPGGKVECSAQELMNFAGVFAKIVDYKSHFTRNHSLGIAEKAYEMACSYGENEETAAKLYFAGAMHDIGKLVISRDVLEKPDKLSDEEFKYIQTHAFYTHKILSAVDGIEDIAEWASYHHEKLDGTGYPFGIPGDKLSRNDRLMACVDIYQALTEERPYKKGMEHDVAIKILRNMADEGKIDGEIVEDINIEFGCEQKAPLATV